MLNLVKRIAPVILVILFIQSSRGQENFIPGYLVRLNGDTLRGFVDYRNWSANPDKIFFREKPGDVTSAYSPLVIRGFRVLDEEYAGAIVETEISSANINNFSRDRELQIKTDTTFLQTMVKGVKSLYYYRNSSGKEQFYIRQESSWELLVHKKFLKEENGQTVIGENNKFIGQLTIYLHDCPELQQKINKAEYQKTKLENLFLAYYKCKGTPIGFRKKTEKTRVEIGLQAGLSVTSLSFTGSKNFTAGVVFDIILPRNNGKWSICNEIAFSSFKTSGQYDEYSSADKYQTTYTTRGFSYLEMNNMLRFKYPLGKVSLFVNTGVSNGYAVSVKNDKKTVSTLFTQQRVEEANAINGPRRWDLGFLAGVGAKFSRFSLEARYKLCNGLTDQISLKSSVNRFYFLLGFMF